MGSGGGGVIWSIIWLLVLIFVGWEIAMFCAFFYIILIALTACCEGLKPLTDGLLRGVQFMYFCADNMVNKRSLSEALASPPTPT